MQDYKISNQIIRQYLDSLGMDDPAGIANDPDNCLAASTLRWKYAEPFVVGAKIFWPRGTNGDEDTLLPEEVLPTIALFDSFGNKSVTRAQFESALTSSGVTL